MDAQRKRKLGIGIVVLALGAWGLHAFLTRPGTSEEARVRGTVEAMAARAEDANANEFLALVDDAYRDNRGHANKAAFASTLKALLARFALGSERLAVSIERLEVVIAPEPGRATATVAFASWSRNASTPKSMVVPSGAKKLEFELELTKGTDGEWRVARATEKSVPR